MRTPSLAIAALVALIGAASADPWKDESGHSRWRGEYRDDYRGNRDGCGYGYSGRYGGDYAREHKQEFRRGNCKFERKWGRGGEYKEKVKCK